MTISTEKLITQLKWRYATKKFDSSKKISQENWDKLQEAIVLSPSSYGLQPWNFLVVQNTEIRKKLTPASWNQPQIEDCSHYVVILAKTSMDETYIGKFITSIAETRGIAVDALEGYKQMMIGDLVKGARSQDILGWASKQCYIAFGNMMTSAALLGIDACPLEGINPQKYDEILDIKNSGYATIAACAFGYRSVEDKYQEAKKVRFPLDEIIQTV
ncbi:MAG: NAD(P)H-dependent oxidoreductase [Bacteriovoracaceae bacterium]|nr:NAD(P)H-dependent oxidoreductase [Bacteriovoracaceae bacterium]